MELPQQEWQSPRQLLLSQATKIVSADRNAAYGNPEDNFENIANLWKAYLTAKAKGSTLTVSAIGSQDVAHMMILLKLARLSTNPGHWDSLVDAAGYAACAADCQVVKTPPKDSALASRAEILRSKTGNPT